MNYKYWKASKFLPFDALGSQVLKQSEQLECIIVVLGKPGVNKLTPGGARLATPISFEHMCFPTMFIHDLTWKRHGYTWNAQTVLSSYSKKESSSISVIDCRYNAYPKEGGTRQEEQQPTPPPRSAVNPASAASDKLTLRKASFFSK